MRVVHSKRLLAFFLLFICLSTIAIGIVWALLSPKIGGSFTDATFPNEEFESPQSPGDTYESPQSIPSEAGRIRSPESCEPGSRGDLLPSDVLVAVDGIPLGDTRSLDGNEINSPTIQASSDLPLWKGMQEEHGRTSSPDQRLHLVGMGEEGVGLGNLQALQAPAHPASAIGGQVTSDGFRPFGSVVFLDQQLPGEAQAAPIAGSINQGQAVWIEQLVTGSPQRANEYPWRIMSASFNPGAPVKELLSSWALSQSPTSPAVTSWRAPVTNGEQLAAEYWYHNTSTKQWESRVGIVSLDAPGKLQSSYQGRLPIAVGADVAWVEDTTNFGIDAEHDVFTVRWLNDSHAPLVLQTSAYAKVQWLEGTPEYLVLALQDACTGMTWLGRYDRSSKAFTAWVESEQDRIVASLNGNVLVWGNGSGNRGSQMYRWDLTTTDVHYLGELEGYSVPFSSGKHSIAVPSFTVEGGSPLVSWGWFSDKG